MMRFYCVQHGDALTKEVDPDRALSTEGQADVTRMASFLQNRIHVTRIVHSGKTRARQTAEILAASVAPGVPVDAIAGINPDDMIEPFAQKLIERGEDTLVVGHQPFMEKLVAWLVTGTEEPAVTAFLPGSIICLGSEDGVRWMVWWMMRPELLSE